MPIETYGWKFEYWSDIEIRDKFVKSDSRGTMIYGLFLEGGKWNYETKMLEE